MASSPKRPPLIWPTLTYALIPLSSLMPGREPVQCDLQSAVTEIANCCSRACAERVLILDTGISTLAPVEAAIKRPIRRIRHLKVFAGPRFVETAALQQQPAGSHADEIETSLMLAIAPGSVDLTRAASPVSPGGPQRGPLSPSDPNSPNYSPSGNFGDPTLASAEKGKTILAAIVADLMEAAA